MRFAAGEITEGGRMFLDVLCMANSTTFIANRTRWRFVNSQSRARGPPASGTLQELYLDEYKPRSAAGEQSHRRNGRRTCTSQWSGSRQRGGSWPASSCGCPSQSRPPPPVALAAPRGQRRLRRSACSFICRPGRHCNASVVPPAWASALPRAPGPSRAGAYSEDHEA